MAYQQATPNKTTEAGPPANRAVARRPSGPASGRVALSARLQRAIGNQATRRWLERGDRAKRAAIEVCDVQEREADRITEQVLRMPDRTGGVRPATRSGDAAPVDGLPLPESVRAFFEPRFGYDFSQVRVHTDDVAAKLARAENADAFTVGRHIVFADRHFDRSTIGGRRLLTHELTHVVQQTAAGLGESIIVGDMALSRTSIGIARQEAPAGEPGAALTAGDRVVLSMTDPDGSAVGPARTVTVGDDGTVFDMVFGTRVRVAGLSLASAQSILSTEFSRRARFPLFVHMEPLRLGGHDLVRSPSIPPAGAAPGPAPAATVPPEVDPRRERVELYLRFMQNRLAAIREMPSGPEQRREGEALRQFQEWFERNKDADVILKTDPGTVYGGYSARALIKDIEAQSAREVEARQIAASELAPSQLPALTGVRVLVVDDEADMRELLRTILAQCGAEVTVAANVRAALDVLDQEPVDVLVSDILMPEEDGYDLIRKVRAFDVERGGQIPALALTAYSRIEDREAALSAGYQQHAAKPIDPAELAAAVATLAGRTAAR